MSEPRDHDRIDTLLVHAGEPRPRLAGAVSHPIFQTANYEYAGETGYHDVRYIRLNNTPNHLALHAKLASLEGTEAALVAASGMAAITTTLLTVLRAGDHLLALDSVYGGTHSFIGRDLADFGIAHDFVRGDDPGAWKAALRPTTRAFYVESLTNPLVQVPELEAAAAFARDHGLTSLVDNTFATPVNYRPAEWGFDLVLHSATKYLNGHSDIVAGAVLGPAALVERIGHRLDHLGGTLDPHACFLLQRGLKTLALRVRHQQQGALALARLLAAHPAVARVHYPGLDRDPGHDRARRWFDGFGGMLAFEPVGGEEAARRLIARLRLPLHAPSLGGVETLVTLPSTTSHSGLDRAARLRLGISDGLVRVSVGLEAAEDLVADLEQALAAPR
jgi:cystathionine beta-lyase/cystathionine gamma-synthase